MIELGLGSRGRALVFGPNLVDSLGLGLELAGPSQRAGRPPPLPRSSRRAPRPSRPQAAIRDTVRKRTGVVFLQNPPEITFLRFFARALRPRPWAW